MNLHHFLYQKASGRQLSKLQEDGNPMLDIGEKAIEEALSSEQRMQMDEAVDYYKNHVIQKGLLRGLGNERYWLQQQNGFTVEPDSIIPQRFVEVLNTVSTTYKETYWPLHKRHNEEIREHHMANIRTLEEVIIPRMERLSLVAWPAGQKARVDLTVYANYAGAYTPTRPIFNLIVSTIDPRSYGPEFLETIFHEGCHLLFRYGGPWRERIFEQFEAGQYNMEFPRHLWHVSLFYLCGRVCTEEFERIGSDDYRMILVTRNIFKTYQHQELFDILDDYVVRNRELKTTVIELLQLLETKSAR